MVKPNCVKCGSTEFEIVRTALKNTAYVDFVQCVKCGGVVNAYSIPAVDKKLQKEIVDKLNKIENEVDHIRRAMR